MQWLNNSITQYDLFIYFSRFTINRLYIEKNNLKTPLWLDYLLRFYLCVCVCIYIYIYILYIYIYIYILIFWSLSCLVIRFYRNLETAHYSKHTYTYKKKKTCPFLCFSHSPAALEIMRRPNDTIKIVSNSSSPYDISVRATGDNCCMISIHYYYNNTQLSESKLSTPPFR